VAGPGLREIGKSGVAIGDDGGDGGDGALDGGGVEPVAGGAAGDLLGAGEGADAGGGRQVPSGVVGKQFADGRDVPCSWAWTKRSMSVPGPVGGPACLVIRQQPDPRPGVGDRDLAAAWNRPVRPAVGGVSSDMLPQSRMYRAAIDALFMADQRANPDAA